MAHFAKVVDGIVTEVIVAEQDFIDTHCTGTWIQTSYNTREGVHMTTTIGEDDSHNPWGGYILTKPSDDQSKALRANFPGIGWVYDETNDIFKLLKLYQFDAPLINTNNFTIEYSDFRKLLDDVRSLNLSYACNDKRKNFENKKYFIHLEKQFRKKY